jgi:elongator complex protein 1
VNVGWGKKETQFHGSEGKAAAKIVKEKVVQSISKDDDGMPRISWRGDGAYFVCSFIDPVDGMYTLNACRP